MTRTTLRTDLVRQQPKCSSAAPWTTSPAVHTSLRVPPCLCRPQYWDRTLASAGEGRCSEMQASPRLAPLKRTLPTCFVHFFPPSVSAHTHLPWGSLGTCSHSSANPRYLLGASALQLRSRGDSFVPGPRVQLLHPQIPTSLASGRTPFRNTGRGWKGPSQESKAEGRKPQTSRFHCPPTSAGRQTGGGGPEGSE